MTPTYVPMVLLRQPSSLREGMARHQTSKRLFGGNSIILPKHALGVESHDNLKKQSNWDSAAFLARQLSP